LATFAFVKWFATSKYALMERYLPQLERGSFERDPARLRARFQRVLALANRVRRMRIVVTVFLAMGIIATVVSRILDRIPLHQMLGADEAFIHDVLDNASTFSASFAVVFLGLRLAFDRYLARIDVNATFLAIEIATSRR